MHFSVYRLHVKECSREKKKKRITCNLSYSIVALNSIQEQITVCSMYITVSAYIICIGPGRNAVCTLQYQFYGIPDTPIPTIKTLCFNVRSIKIGIK